jgi:hypothetical protein
MAKKNNNAALAPSAGEGWDAWGAACGFTSWAKAAEAIGIGAAQMVTIRKKSPRRTIRLAMDAVLAARLTSPTAAEPVQAAQGEAVDIDTIALRAAEEITLMRGKDRTQLVAKIQVRVITALRRCVLADDPSQGESA